MTMETETATALPGIWTPWAQVLCYQCHGPTRHTGIPIDEGVIRDNSKPRQGIPEGDFDWGEVATGCDLCNERIWISGDAGLLGSLRPLLKKGNSQVRADLSQTGGMCAALEVYLVNDDFERHDSPRVVVTCLDGPFCIARYENDAQQEAGNLTGSAQEMTRDHRIEGVVSRVLSMLESHPEPAEMLAVLRAVRASVSDALSPDPSTDWRDSLSDALDAIDATIEGATKEGA